MVVSGHFSWSRLGEVLPASGGWRPGMPLTLVPRPGWPPEEAEPPGVSVVPS